MTKRDLVDGLCPNHKKAPEAVTEENWFFLMSKDTGNLKDLLTKNWDDEEYRIVPVQRAQETLSLIEQGLEDVSFSRPTSSLTWGIPVPDDEGQTMYVWCDALTNYISGIDYFGMAAGHERRPKGGVEWWDDAEVTHVIGKDIARFHALIWPDMLKHAGIRIPDRLLIHGFLTSEGEKMSKSIGNVVKPDDVLAKFDGNPDPIRFYLSHEVPVGNDGDFSWERFEELYDAKLRNQLGNLLNRVLVLLHKSSGGTLALKLDETDVKFAPGHWTLYREAMDEFRPHLALQLQINGLLTYGNGLMDSAKPWTLGKDEAVDVLSHLAEKLRHVSLMLLPFIPDTAYRISKQLNVPYAEEMLNKNFVLKNAQRDLTEWGSCAKDWKEIGQPSILFAPLS